MPNADPKHIAAEARTHAAEAAASLGALPDGVSLSRFIADYAAVGDMVHYVTVPEPAADAVRKVSAAHGPEGARTFLRAALAQGAADLVESGRLDALPPRILHYQLKHLARIAGATAANADWMDIERDLFHKDFGLVTLRLFAAAAQLLDIRCGIPRSILFTEGALASVRKGQAIMGMGGFKPYVQIHTHLSDLDDFNEEGWNACYRCCAELYERMPQLLGMFGASWFYDPALDEISPRLAYLRKIPEDGGAHLFYVSSGGSQIDNATSTSPSRRKLYEEGKYMPKSYMLAWGRREQMAWAKRNPG
ncbi:hypothetical protein [Zoogloea sp.]|uniref:hypothetical protein n=1 Tax=Zoogloea sp. TaxID=49181 RepID=UPI0035B0AA15